MTGPFYFPRPPRPPGKSQPAPTFHTLTRWLTPWRTIRRLEAENKRLKEQAILRAQVNWEARKLIDLKYDQLATAREALRRLVRYYADQDYDSEVVRGVYLWATDNGMTGPLPPLPDHMVNYQPTTTEDQP
jgi:hypothetical protein